VREVHGGEKRQRDVSWLHLRDSEICRELKCSLFNLIIERRYVLAIVDELATLKLNRYGKNILRSCVDQLLSLQIVSDASKAIIILMYLVHFCG
jgi:hypothetical protein